MDYPNFHTEIRELNVAYLVLVQKMLRADRETAMLRVGISQAMADFIENLSAARLVRMANSPVTIPRFRFDDAQLARLMAGEGRDETASTLHAAILAVGRTADEAA